MINKYIKDTGVTFGTQILCLFIALLINIVIARVLGPNGKGIITIAMLFPFFIGMFIAMGIDESNTYLLGSKKSNHSAILSQAIYITILMSVVFVFLLLIFKNWILARVLKNMPSQYFIFLVLSIPFFLFVRYGRTIFQGQANFFKYNLLNIVEYGSRLIFCVFLLIIIKMGIFGGILTIPLYIGLTAFVALFYLLRLGKPAHLPTFPLFKQSLNYGVRAQPGVLLNFFDKRLDMFIVNFFLVPSAVGYYSVSVVIAELLYHLPNALATTLFPKVAGLSSEEADKWTSFIMRNLLFLMIIGVVIIGVLARPIIFILFGAEFYPAILSLRLLLPGIIALGVTKVLCSNFQGKGNPEYGTFLTIISVSFTIVLDLFLIPKFGIEGAAIASSVTYLVSAILATCIFRQKSKIPIKSFLWVNFRELKMLVQKRNEITSYRF